MKLNQRTSLFFLSFFLFFQKSLAQSLLFNTDNKVRLTIGQNGPVTIGLHNFAFKTKLGAYTNSSDSASMHSVNYNQTANVQFGNIYSEIWAPSGAALSGTSVRANTYSSVEGGNSFGVLGNGGPGAIGVGAYSTGGTAIRALLTSGIGYALRTTGPIKLDGISQGANKVLTSDIDGNATWQNLPTLPAGASVWAVAGNNISNTNAGFVGIGHPNPTFGLDVRHLNGAIFHTDPTTTLVNNTVFINKGVGVPNVILSDAALNVRASSDYIAGQFYSGQSNAIYAQTDQSISPQVAAISAYAEWATGIGAYSIHGTGLKTRSANAVGLVAETGAGTAIQAYGENGRALFARSDAGNTAHFENLGPTNNNNLLELIQFGQGPAIKISASSGVGVDLENASLKVSGAKRTAFQVTGTGANSITISNVTTLANAATDMLFVTHSGVLANIVTPVYVKFVGGSWIIYTETGAVIPANEIFNVLVVKQ